MKRLSFLIASLLMASMLLAACAAAGKADETSPSPYAAQASPAVPAAPTATRDLDIARENAERMLPVFDSLLLATGIWEPRAYAPGDADFFWTALYLIGKNSGVKHPLVTENETSVTVPRQVMQEFASAAFFEYDDLLPVPESMSDTVRYDQQQDAYLLTQSDRGDSQPELLSVSINEDGTLLAEFGLLGGDGKLMASAQFTLVGNPYADAIADPVFPYTVSAMSEVKTYG